MRAKGQKDRGLANIAGSCGKKISDNKHQKNDPGGKIRVHELSSNSEDDPLTPLSSSSSSMKIVVERYRLLQQTDTDLDPLHR